nr:copia protein [Tanacetum cinerariifolium]
METLTVESPIPTVSSLVPTACLNDSPKPSSKARLISKRVANQEESPSQDNILPLTNRFEDILGVSTSLDETIRVEADNVWTLVDCPKGVRPIGTKWVLKNKKDERGNVVRSKARLVAQGYTQEEGIDYDEVFTPVARIEAIRLFLAYASFMGFTVYHMDIKSAFLYGTINEEVYVIQPPRFQDPAYPAKKEDGIFLSQDKYIGDILKKFRFSDVRSSNTPMDKENPWGKDGTGKDGHPKLGLWYPKASPFDLVAYSDSDYGGASQDRKSTTGGRQFLGRRLISWQYKKQTIVATLTTETEYVAAASCLVVGKVELVVETQAVLPSLSPLLCFEKEIKAIFWEFGFDFFCTSAS